MTILDLLRALIIRPRRPFTWQTLQRQLLQQGYIVIPPRMREELRNSGGSVVLKI